MSRYTEKGVKASALATQLGNISISKPKKQSKSPRRNQAKSPIKTEIKTEFDPNIKIKEEPIEEGRQLIFTFLLVLILIV